MTVLLLIAVLAAAALAGFFAMRAARLGADLGRSQQERDAALAECEELREKLAELPGVQQSLAATTARLRRSKPSAPGWSGGMARGPKRPPST